MNSLIHGALVRNILLQSSHCRHLDLLPLSVKLAEVLHGLSETVTHSSAIPNPRRQLVLNACRTITPIHENERCPIHTMTNGSAYGFVNIISTRKTPNRLTDALIDGAHAHVLVEFRAGVFGPWMPFIAKSLFYFVCVSHPLL